jgi:hypothetical protein
MSCCLLYPVSSAISEYVIPAPSAFCPSSQSAFSFVALSIAGSFRSVMDRAYSKAKVVTFSRNEGVTFSPDDDSLFSMRPKF